MALHQPRVQSKSMFRCEYCKVWLQDDPITKRIHNQGKKHKENVKLFLLEQQTKRVAAKKDEESRDALLADLEQKASAATTSMRGSMVPKPPSGNPPAFAFDMIQDVQPPSLPAPPDAVRLGTQAYRACISMGYLSPMPGGWPVATDGAVSQKRPRSNVSGQESFKPSSGPESKRSRWGPSSAAEADGGQGSTNLSGGTKARVLGSSTAPSAPPPAFVYQDEYELVVEEPEEQAVDSQEGEEAAGHGPSVERAQGGASTGDAAAAPASADAAEWLAAEEAETGDVQAGGDSATSHALAALQARVGPGQQSGVRSLSSSESSKPGEIASSRAANEPAGGWSRRAGDASATAAEVETSTGSKASASGGSNGTQVVIDPAAVEGLFRSRPQGNSKKKKKKRNAGRR